jgi:hypothetical protein
VEPFHGVELTAAKRWFLEIFYACSSLFAMCDEVLLPAVGRNSCIGVSIPDGNGLLFIAA